MLSLTRSIESIEDDGSQGLCMRNMVAFIKSILLQQLSCANQELPEAGVLGPHPVAG